MVGLLQHKILEVNPQIINMDALCAGDQLFVKADIAEDVLGLVMLIAYLRRAKTPDQDLTARCCALRGLHA